MWLDPNHWRSQMFRHLEINVVIDAGANIGQYAQTLRENDFRGRIVSFEPVDSLFDELVRQAAKDPQWQCKKLALGDTETTAEIKVAGTMSSFLTRAATASEASSFATSETQQVQVKPLDALRKDLYSVADRVWLKTDVQGYEMVLLDGATEALNEIVGIETEMSLWPTYSGQPGYLEMIGYLAAKGFDLWSLSPGHRDHNSGRMIEMDGVFIRKGYLPPQKS